MTACVLALLESLACLFPFALFGTRSTHPAPSGGLQVSWSFTFVCRTVKVRRHRGIGRRNMGFALLVLTIIMSIADIVSVVIPFIAF